MFNSLSVVKNDKKTAGTLVSDPDEDLTDALERIRRAYGTDLAAFFEVIRKKDDGQRPLFDPEETGSAFSADALARCVKK